MIKIFFFVVRSWFRAVYFGFKDGIKEAAYYRQGDKLQAEAEVLRNAFLRGEQ